MANPLYEVQNQADLQLNIGKIIWNRFIDNSLNFPPGGVQHAATAWLTAIGFERVEWYQHGDLELQCQLWYTDDQGISQNFMLEFCGPDGSSLSLWNLTAEADL